MEISYKGFIFTPKVKLKHNDMSIIRSIFSKRKPIIPIPITPTEAELQKIIKEYYSRQNKKKKKWKDLIKL